MNPLNYKKRLISIFQFIGVYALGLILLGFAVSSFMGVSGDEKEALEMQVAELTRQVHKQDSTMKVDSLRWESLNQKANEVDSLANSIQKLDEELSAALAMKEAGRTNAENRKRDIAGVTRNIRYELESLRGKPDSDLQGEIGTRLADAFHKMLTAKSSFRDLQGNIIQDQSDNELMLKNSELQGKIDQLISSKAVGNKLSNCEQKLGDTKNEITEFIGIVDLQSELIDEISKELETIRDEIGSFLGKDKQERVSLSNKINELNGIVKDLKLMKTQMEKASK